MWSLYLFLFFIYPQAWARVEDCNLNKPAPEFGQLFSFSRQLEAFSESNFGTFSREAAVYGRDDRRPVRHQIFPYSAIGKLHFTIEDLNERGTVIGTQKSWCTASLVSQCHLLTARHCVQHQAPLLSGRGYVPRRRYTNHLFEDSRGRTHSIDSRQIGPSDQPQDDFAFLRVASSRPGRELGYIGVLKKSSDQFLPFERFEALGFSADLNSGRVLLGDPRAQTVRPSQDPRFLELRADTFGGASGGPIVRAADNHIPYIAAINTRARATVNHQNVTVTQRHYPENESNELATGLVSNVFYEPMLEFMRQQPCR
jgi:hypothetical protein